MKQGPRPRRPTKHARTELAPREETEADTLRREILEAEAAGMDVSMVRQALQQTPAERIASNDAALAFFAEIRVARGTEAPVNRRKNRRH